MQASSTIQQVFSTLSGIADQALFLTDLLAFFEMKPTIQSKPNASGAKADPAGIRIPECVLSYPGNERRVIEHLNFHLHPGERIALIGENGQGKTTIVKLITRLYDPTEGQILLDGVDLREYDLEDLYREIGVIFQDFMRYEMTARENIAIGRSKNSGAARRSKAAAQKSLADEVIARLPAGFEQMLGRRFEGGVDLSGGEWQKLALARAYLRNHNCSFLTNRPPRSTRAANTKSLNVSPNSRLERWHCSSRTAFQPCAWPIASWCSKVAGS